MNEGKQIRQCPYCKKEIEPGATACPHCHQTFVSTNPLKNLLWSLLFFFILYYLVDAFVSCEMKRETKKMMRETEQEIDELQKRIDMKLR